MNKCVWDGVRCLNMKVYHFWLLFLLKHVVCTVCDMFSTKNINLFVSKYTVFLEPWIQCDSIRTLGN